MSKDEEQTIESQNNEQVRAALQQFLQIVLGRSKKEINKLASDGRKALELRSLKKDRMKMYEKLGREVELLIEAGEITHPGLIRGVERIHQLGLQIQELEEYEGK